MTAVEPTAEALTRIVDELLLTENVHDPRLDHGTLTTPYLAALSLRDEGIAPTPALVERVLELVEARRSGVDAA